MSRRATGVCELTGQPGKLIDCHLVPKSFLSLEQIAGDVPLKIYPIHKKGYPKASQTGLYDNAIVGESGERILARLDTAADRVLNSPVTRASYLKDSNGFILRDRSGNELAYGIPQEHYLVLKLFVLSIFWRASVSRRPEVSQFKLEPHVKARIRDLIVSNMTTPSDDLSVVITRYTNELGAPHITPSRLKISDLDFVQTAFGQYHFYMKTDDQRTASPLDEMQMDPNRPLVVLLGDFLETGLGQKIRSKFMEFYR